MLLSLIWVYLFTGAVEAAKKAVVCRVIRRFISADDVAYRLREVMSETPRVVHPPPVEVPRRVR